MLANAEQTVASANIEIRNLKLMGAGGSTVEFIALGTGSMAGDTLRRARVTECYITNSADNGILLRCAGFHDQGELHLIRHRAW